MCDRAVWLDKGVVRGIGDVFMITALYTEHLFNGSKPDTEPAEATQAETAAVTLMQHRPINHWGSHVGLIISAGLYNRQGEQKSLFVDYEPMTVKNPVPSSNAEKVQTACRFHSH